MYREPFDVAANASERPNEMLVDLALASASAIKAIGLRLVKLRRSVGFVC
jgi:hypothetical protein